MSVNPIQKSFDARLAVESYRKKHGLKTARYSRPQPAYRPFDAASAVSLYRASKLSAMQAIALAHQKAVSKADHPLRLLCLVSL